MVKALQRRVTQLEMTFFSKPFVALGPEDFSFEDYVPESETKPGFDDDNGIEYQTTEHTDKTG